MNLSQCLIVSKISIIVPDTKSPYVKTQVSKVLETVVKRKRETDRQRDRGKCLILQGNINVIIMKKIQNLLDRYSDTHHITYKCFPSTSNVRMGERMSTFNFESWMISKTLNWPWLCLLLTWHYWLQDYEEFSEMLNDSSVFVVKIWLCKEIYQFC